MLATAKHNVLCTRLFFYVILVHNIIKTWNKSRRKLYYTIELLLPAENAKYCYVLRNDFNLLKTY